MSIAWPPPPRIVVLTGPGLSRESGFAPFDPATMPEGASLADVVTPQGFADNPARVQQFYNLRRRQSRKAAPNPGHYGLAMLDIARAGEVMIVTRNIDDLHERAGAQSVIHTHGELLKARCTVCTKISDRHDDITADTECPVCGNAGHLRPHVVWVGEPPLRMDAVYQAVAECKLLLVVGAAVVAEPWTGLVAAARRAAAHTVEFSLEPSPDADRFDRRICGPFAETVPEYVKQLIAA